MRGMARVPSTTWGVSAYGLSGGRSGMGSGGSVEVVTDGGGPRWSGWRLADLGGRLVAAGGPPGNGTTEGHDGGAAGHEEPAPVGIRGRPRRARVGRGARLIGSVLVESVVESASVAESTSVGRGTRHHRRSDRVRGDLVARVDGGLVHGGQV